jgi:hypothetical protein
MNIGPNQIGAHNWNLPFAEPDAHKQPLLLSAELFLCSDPNRYLFLGCLLPPGSVTSVIKRYRILITFTDNSGIQLDDERVSHGIVSPLWYHNTRYPMIERR